MTDDRDVGVQLVARALGCTQVALVRRDLRGRVAVRRWDAGGVAAPGVRAVRDGGAAASDAHAVADALAALPVLRPALAPDAALLVALPTVGTAGWRLAAAGGFGPGDVRAAARLVPVLADPAMLGPVQSGPGVGEARLLTAREAQVLALVGEGLTAQAVGRRCGISVRTVHKHLEQAYRKLDCHDRLSAVLLARDAGLLRAGSPVPVG